MPCAAVDEHAYIQRSPIPVRPGGNCFQSRGRHDLDLALFEMIFVKDIEIYDPALLRSQFTPTQPSSTGIAQAGIAACRP